MQEIQGTLEDVQYRSTNNTEQNTPIYTFLGLLAAKYELSTEQIHAALSCLPSYSESRNNLERFLGAVTRNGLVECVGLDRWRLAEQLE